MEREHIYRIEFWTSPVSSGNMAGEKVFYFHSLTAIYKLFTPEQVGCKVTNLWNLGVSRGREYQNHKCKVKRHPIYRATRE